MLDKIHAKINTEQIQALCRPLFECTIFSRVDYIRVYRDKPDIFILSSDAACGYSRAPNISFQFDRLFEGGTRKVIFSSKKFSQLLPECFSLFIDWMVNEMIVSFANSLYLLYKKEDVTEIICFSTNGDLKNIVEFYCNNIEVLEAFVIYFCNQYKLLTLEEKFKTLEYPSSFLNFEDKNSSYSALGQSSFLSEKLSDYPIEGNLGETTLSSREAHCLAEIALGRSAKTIARSWDLQSKTVETHIYNIKLKLGCNTKDDLVKFYLAAPWRKIIRQ